MDLTFNKDLTNQLQTFVTKNNITMNTALLAVWGILLGKFNGTKEVVLPNLVSVRPPEVEGIENMCRSVHKCFAYPISMDRNAIFCGFPTKGTTRDIEM